jgi:hypothetical protein
MIGFLVPDYDTILPSAELMSTNQTRRIQPPRQAITVPKGLIGISPHIDPLPGRDLIISLDRDGLSKLG